MPELNAILKESRRQDYETKKFNAAIQGIDLEEGRVEEEFARVQRNAAKRVAELTGNEEGAVDPAIKEFMENGFDYEDLTNV